MDIKRVQKKTHWTPEDRARHAAIREKFKDRPTAEQLTASGEISGPFVSHGIYLDMRLLLQELKKAREAAGLSLAEVQERSGMDKATLSRLENGHTENPTLETLLRYAKAVGKRLECRLVSA